VADLRLSQYISDKWFTSYRKNLDSFIRHFGQEVRLIKRSSLQYNNYSDLIRSVSTAATEKAIISKRPLESNFMAPPLVYTDDSDSIAEFYAYFQSTSKVRVGDIVVIETKSIENDVVLDAYEVQKIKGKKTEQEYIRRYMLAPMRDSFSSEYEDPSILETTTVVEEHSENDAVKDPGGYTDGYYETEEIVNPPGTEGFVTPEVLTETNFGPDPFSPNPYVTDFPTNNDWYEGRPYDVGKPLTREEVD